MLWLHREDGHRKNGKKRLHSQVDMVYCSRQYLDLAGFGPTWTGPISCYRCAICVILVFIHAVYHILVGQIGVVVFLHTNIKLPPYQVVFGSPKSCKCGLWVISAQVQVWLKKEVHILDQHVWIDHSDMLRIQNHLYRQKDGPKFGPRLEIWPIRHWPCGATRGCPVCNGVCNSTWACMNWAEKCPLACLKGHFGTSYIQTKNNAAILMAQNGIMD